MSKNLNKGSRWVSRDGSSREFTIIDVKDVEGHTWVHYRDNNSPPKEYSCYLESFLSRFMEHANDKRA